MSGLTIYRLTGRSIGPNNPNWGHAFFLPALFPAVHLFGFFFSSQFGGMSLGGGVGVQSVRHPNRTAVKGTPSNQKAIKDKSKLNGRGDSNSTKSVPQPQAIDL